MGEILKRLFSFVVLVGLVWVARVYGDLTVEGVGGTALALGFLLLAAYVGGQIAKQAELSRVTGYIVVGLLVGPSALGMVTEADVADLGLLNDVAIALIALTAGGELSLSRLKGMGRSLASITLVGTVVLFLLVAGTVLALSAWLPFTAGRSSTLVLIVAVVFGSVAIASSPAVAIAVITDSKAEGPVSTTVMGVTVMKDVLVIVAFAVALSVAYAVLDSSGAGDVSLALSLTREIGGSMVAGALLGVGIAAYLRWVGTHMVLFTVGGAWLAAEVAAVLHLEVLLLGLTAGFTLENVLPVRGHDFVASLEQASLPIYALFFSLAGASVHLEVLGDLWQWALLLIAVRAFGLWLGTDLGARIGRADEPVRRWAWMGFISQAGVTLGMVTILEASFPSWGAELKALFVAMVAVHELVGPAALDWMLRRTGEAGSDGSGDDTPADRARSRVAADAPVGGDQPLPERA